MPRTAPDPITPINYFEFIRKGLLQVDIDQAIFADRFVVGEIILIRRYSHTHPERARVVARREIERPGFHLGAHVVWGVDVAILDLIDQPRTRP